MRGRVIRISGLQCLVEVGGDHWQCAIRGRLKAGVRKTNSPVVAGDWVDIATTAERTGIIEAVLPRTSKFSRGASGSRPFEQILSANLDQLVVVVAARQPSPRTGFIDRAIVMAIKGNLQPVICINKVDLVSDSLAGDLAAPYAALDYQVFLTSATRGDEMDKFKRALQNRVSAVVGQSGVGKSTLLNAIEPALGLKTKEVMKRHDRGRHTTTAVHLFKLQQGGYVADTPGIKELRLWGIKRADLDRYYPEILPLLGQCQFGDCSHLHEPYCAIREAVASGQMAQSRYEAYIRIAESLEGYE
ncbi:MAG: ribosome small subunit-dependent GTPase A [Candidatus Latescibacterota bacterium]|nr:ribosome small subunit-dependent GTPase A [Candidatus Latescibacterota bacterium]